MAVRDGNTAPALPVPPPMPRIRALPKEVVDRIAAGEVVQRPASVAKELIENSLDANSTCIDILCCASGGMHLLSISDDGDGIHPSDLNLAAVRFATSKLVKFDDLKSVSTFGFRGEALASASMVSRLAISSRCRRPRSGEGGEAAGGYSSSCAYKQTFRDGAPDRPRPTPAAGNVGTTVKVEVGGGNFEDKAAKDLFYNVPSRRRAFAGARREAEEYSRTLSVAQRYAVHEAARGVAFVCKRKRRGGGGAGGGGAQCDLNTQSLAGVKRARAEASSVTSDTGVGADRTGSNGGGAAAAETSKRDGMETSQAGNSARRDVIGHVFGSAVAKELLSLRGGEGDVDAVSAAALRSMRRQQEPKEEGDGGAAAKRCGEPSADAGGTNDTASGKDNSDDNSDEELQFSYAYSAVGLVTNGSYCAPKSAAAFVLFVNDRLVDCPSLRRAVESVYADVLPRGGRPFVYLSLRVPGPHVDVNVHPTKREVAVLYEDRICDDMARLVREVLGSATASRTFYAQALLPAAAAAAAKARGRGRPDGGGGDDVSRNDAKRGRQMVDARGEASNETAVGGDATDGGGGGAAKEGVKEDHLDAEGEEVNATQKKKRPATAASSANDGPSSSKKKAYDPKRLVRTTTAAPAGALEPFLVQTQPRGSPKAATEASAASGDAPSAASAQNAYTFQHSDDCEFAAANSGDGKRPTSTLDMNAPGAFAAICRCQIERGGRGLPVGGQSSEQRPPSTVVRPKRVIPTECIYDSVHSLRADVSARAHRDLASKLRDSTYVGLVSRQRSLIQWGIELLMINHYELAREMFYQLALARFGGAKMAQLGGGDGGGGIDVKEVIEQALNTEEELECDGKAASAGNSGDALIDSNQTNSDLAEQAATCLRDRAEMLREYFGISLESRKTVAADDEEGKERLFLVGLPVLLDGHAPCPHGLPVFLLRLATEVDWRKERDCFQGVCTEMGYFYAEVPFEEEKQQRQKHERNASDEDHAPDAKLVDPVATKFVKHTLFPALSFLLVPPRDFATDGTVVKLALLSSLYKVFERC